MFTKNKKILAAGSANIIAKTASVAGLIALSLSSSSASAQADPGFYYLICRGGDQMNPIIQSQQDSTRIIFDFRASANGWNEQPKLAPGECTWVDRKVSSQEPSSISFEIPADVQQTTSWRPNLKAFIFPFQKPIKVTRTTERVAIQVVNRTGGFFLKVMKPSTTSRRTSIRSKAQSFETIMTLDLSSQSYLTFSVKNIDGVFVANRLTKGVLTGETLRIESKPIPAPRRPAPRASDR